MVSRIFSARRHLTHPGFIVGLGIALIYGSSSEASSLPDAYWQGQEEIIGCFSPCQISGGAGVNGIGNPPSGWYQAVNGTYVPGQPIILPPDLTERSGDLTTIAQASVSTLLPFPGIDVTASISPDGPNNWGQNASINVQFAYFFEITGPNGNVPVINLAFLIKQQARPSLPGFSFCGPSHRRRRFVLRQCLVRRFTVILLTSRISAMAASVRPLENKVRTRSSNFLPRPEAWAPKYFGISSFRNGARSRCLVGCANLKN